MEALTDTIFPVFAGMIPHRLPTCGYSPHFPRIRGDDPGLSGVIVPVQAFSPYSRG